MGLSVKKRLSQESLSGACVIKVPERIEMKPEELDALVERVKSGSLHTGDSQIIESMAETLKFLSSAMDEKNMSIKRLRRILFGARTEKAENVLKKDTSGKRTSGTAEKKKAKGHGRNGADAYTGAERVVVEHKTLKPGDPCTLCPKGKVYPMTEPKKVVWVIGQAPMQATVIELEKLRCNLCQNIFTAELPEDYGKEKYDETTGSMIALLKYGSGFPFNRIEKLQAGFGIPLAASTQWGIVEAKAKKISAVYDELVRQAAQGEVIHNDDTAIKILEFMSKDEGEYEGKAKPRKGMFTTGVFSRIGEQKIALYFTGRKHAGENMAALLSYRDFDRGPPIQMCDALARNLPKDFKVLLANCLAHARRRFIDVTEIFPEECRFVIETLKDVYKNEATTKQRGMSDDERLAYHQAESGHLMESLKDWLQKRFEQRKVEPNSSLGEAISYMLKHWQPLTLFLEVPGAPLDNNLCEQVLKRAILHRKNSLFYKTQNGAYIGDLYMSLIHSCNLAGVNPFDYLTELERNSDAAQKNPDRWLPWNYEQTLAPLARKSPADIRKKS